MLDISKLAMLRFQISEPEVLYVRHLQRTASFTMHAECHVGAANIMPIRRPMHMTRDNFSI